MVQWLWFHTNCRCTCVLSPVWLFAAPWTVGHQAPLSMRFSRQEYWTRLPFPTPGDLLEPRIKPMSPALAGGFFTTEPLWKPSTVIFIDSILLSTGVQKLYPRAFSHPMQWSLLSPGIVYVHVCVCETQFSSFKTTLRVLSGVSQTSSNNVSQM